MGLVGVRDVLARLRLILLASLLQPTNPLTLFEKVLPLNTS